MALVTVYCIILASLKLVQSENRTNGNKALIYKGFSAQIHQYSHAVFLSFKLTRPRSCGASLIMTQAVLTAAHCVDELRYKSGEITAYIGATVPKDANILRQVVDYKIHPKYSENKGKNNIAVAFLDRRVPLSHYVKKIPFAVKDSSVNDEMFSAGWGKQTLPNKLPDISRFRSLKATKQRVISRVECSRHAGFRVGLENVCTVPMIGYNYKDDSGNGLITRQPVVLLVGVLSYVSNYVSIYTSVLHYKDWITKTLKDMYQKICLGKRTKIIG